MIDILKQDLKNILAMYQQQVGRGFFTRRSRLKLIEKLRVVENDEDFSKTIALILEFAQSMQGEKADAGFFGHSRLHSFLWGSFEAGTRTQGCFYQKMYEFLLSDPKGKIIFMDLTKKKTQHSVSLLAPSDSKMLEEMLGYNWNGNHSLRRI